LSIGSIVFGCSDSGDFETVRLEYPKLFSKIIGGFKPRCAEGICYASKPNSREINKLNLTIVSGEVLDKVSEPFLDDYYRSVGSIARPNGLFSFLILSTTRSNCIKFRHITVGKGDRWIEKINYLELIKIRKYSQLASINSTSVFVYDKSAANLAKLYKEFPNSGIRNKNLNEFISVSGQFCKDMRDYNIDISSIDIWFKAENYPHIPISHMKSISVN
jgi:hypothetical protein